MDSWIKKRFRHRCAWFFLICQVVLLSTCGYRPLSSARIGRTRIGGGKTVIIPLVSNRTAFGGLTEALTAALRRETALRGLRVATNSSPERAPRLEVIITGAKQAPSAITIRNQRILPAENLIGISVSARLIDGGGALVLGPLDFSCEERAVVGQTALAEEALAHDTRKTLLVKLAGRVASRFFDSL